MLQCKKKLRMLSGVALGALAHSHAVAQDLEGTEGEPVDQIVVIGERTLGLQLERDSVNKKSVIETEDANDLPDINAAEAIQRLPGVYIDEDRGEGRFVSIRGANSTFNQVTLNGLQLGSPESNGLSVPLDVFPPGALARIEVTKSTTPSLPANSVGGSIQLTTPTILGDGDPSTAISFRGGFHDLGGGKRIRTRANTGFVFGDNDQFGIALNASYEVRDLLAETIETTDLDLEDGTTGADFVDLGFGDEVWVIDSLELRNQEVRRERISLGGVMEWTPSDQSRLFAQLNFSRFEEDEFRLLKEFELEDGAGAVSDDTDLVVAARMPFGSIADQKFLEDGTAVTRYPSVVRGNFLGSDEATDQQFQRDFTPQNFWIGALGYEYFGDTWEVQLNAGYSRTTEYRERDRLNGEGGVTDFLFDATGDPQTPIVTIIGGDDVIGDPFTVDFDDFQIDEDRRFDEVYTISGDLRHNTELFSNPLTLSIGGRATLRNREIDENDIEYNPDLYATFGDVPGLAVADISPEFFNGLYDFGFGTSLDFIKDATADPEGVLGVVFDTPGDADLLGGDSIANEDVYAGYFEFLYETGPLTLLGGVRVEHTELSIDAFQEAEIEEAAGGFVDIEAVTAVSGSQSYTNVFPSIHARYDLTDELIFRASAAKTLRRPNFNDLIPAGSVEATIDLADPTAAAQSVTLSIGNPNLTPLISWNYEVSLDWYSHTLGYIGVAFFYKEISDITVDNAIQEDVSAAALPQAVATLVDPAFLTGEFGLTTLTVNSESSGEILGIEASYSKKFTELPGFLSNFGVDANVTWTDSEQDIPLFDDEVLDAVVTFPFVGQSPLSGNVTLAYEDGPFKARITNAFSKGFLNDSVFEDTSPVVDQSVYDRDFSRWGAKVQYAVRENVELTIEGNNFNDRLLRRLRSGDVNTFRETELNGWWLEFGIEIDL